MHGRMRRNGRVQLNGLPFSQRFHQNSTRQRTACDHIFPMRLHACGGQAMVNRVAFMPRQHPPSLPVLPFLSTSSDSIFNSLSSAAPECLGRAVPRVGCAGAVGYPEVAWSVLQTQLSAFCCFHAVCDLALEPTAL